MKIQTVGLLALSPWLGSLVWGQNLEFDALKSLAFIAPDSVHAIALTAYDEAWIQGESGLVEWAYLLGLTDYLQSAFLSSNAWYAEGLEQLKAGQFSTADSLKWSASLWNNIGINHEIMLDYDRAREALEQSRRAERELGNEAGEWVTAINEGLLLGHMGKADEAVSVLQEAAGYFSSAGDKGNEGKAWLNLGLAYAKLQQYQSAHQATDRALDLFSEVNDSTEVYNALINKGENLVLDGRLQDLDALFDQMNDWRPRLLSVRQRYHEQVLRARWELFHANIAAAQQYLDTANELSNTAPLMGSSLKGVEAMIAIAHAQGTPEIAYNSLLTQISDFERRTNELAAGYALQVVKLQERSQRLASIQALKQELNHSENIRLLLTVLLVLLLLSVASVIAWGRARMRSRQVVFQMAKRSRDRLKRSKGPSVEAAETVQPEHRALFEKLLAHIEDEASFLDPAFSLSVLSSAVEANPRYISEAIKQVRGCNFSQFINEMRIERAIDMLMDESNDHLSLDQIAEACGFSNLRTFYRNFERQVNTTPAAFRKMAKKDKS